MTTTHGDIIGLHKKVEILWNIPNYFSNQKADFYYNSPDFYFLGSTWSIRIYPNGQRICSSVEYVGISILQEEEHERHDVYFNVDIVYNGDKVLVGGNGYVSNGKLYTHWDKFTERKALIKNRLLIAPDGTLSIKLVGTPLSNTVLHKESQTKILEGMNALTRDFQALYNSGEASDLTIRVKSRVFHAHKLILVTRSPVFAAMFKYDMKEKITGSIDIEDCEPSAFQEFLAFVYTGKIDNLSSENVFDILFLANKYDLSDLKQICIDFIEDNLCLDMVCNVLSIADKFSLVDLKKSAIELFQKSKTSVMLTKNWISFIKENPELATEILIKAFP